MSDFGNAHPLDWAEFSINVAAQMTLTIAASFFSEPSGGSPVRAALQAGLGIPNTVSPGPFIRASSAWGEFANQLRTERETVQQVVNRVGSDGDGNMWTGPGAEAFRSYANNDLLKGIDDLINTADQISGITMGFATGSWQWLFFNGMILDLIKGYAIQTVVLAYQMSVYPTQFIPIVGPGIFAGATWAGIASEGFGWADLVASVIIDVIGYSEAKGQMGGLIDQLNETFGSESQRLDTEAESISRREHGDLVDPESWGKD